MILMGVEVIAGVMVIPAALVLLLHAQRRQSPGFRHWTLPLAWASFLWFGVLFALG
jgi:SNF family Na+-dependent transporter